MLITRTQRTEVYDYFSGQLGYRVLFIECVCNDPEVLEYNQQEIVRHCADYTGMDAVLAAENLRSKIAFYTGLYEPMDDRTYPRIKINTATMDIETCKVSGHIETSVLGYLGDISLKPHTLYFSRVSSSSSDIFYIMINKLCQKNRILYNYVFYCYCLRFLFCFTIFTVYVISYIIARRKRVQRGR